MTQAQIVTPLLNKIVTIRNKKEALVTALAENDKAYRGM
jgi:hypothetical protein